MYFTFDNTIKIRFTILFYHINIAAFVLTNDFLSTRPLLTVISFSSAAHGFSCCFYQELAYERRLTAEATRARDAELASLSERSRLLSELQQARADWASERAALTEALALERARGEETEAALTLELARQRKRLSTMMNDEVDAYDTAVDAHEQETRAVIEATAQKTLDLKQTNAVFKGRIGELQRKLAESAERLQELEAARAEDALAAGEMRKKTEAAQALLAGVRAQSEEKDERLARLTVQVDALQNNRYVY